MATWKGCLANDICNSKLRSPPLSYLNTSCLSHLCFHWYSCPLHLSTGCSHTSGARCCHYSCSLSRHLVLSSWTRHQQEAPGLHIQWLKHTQHNWTELNRTSEHEFHETCHSVTFYFLKKDSKRCCDTTMPDQFTPKMKANAVPRLLSSLV